jgi:hypothetical protein
VVATKTAKNPTAHNDTPNTPKVRESAIAGMKVDELRRKLRGHGIKGTADLKKPELVQQLIKAEVAATKKSSSTKKTATASSAKKSTTGSSAKKTATGSSAKSASAKSASAKSSTGKSSTAKTATVKKSTGTKSSAKNPTSHNDTPNTPDVSETAIAGMKADALRRKLRGHGVKGTADLRKPELVKQLTKIEVGSAKKKSAKKSAKAGSAK